MIAVSTTMKHSPASLFCLPASIVERFRLQVDEACQPRMHLPAQLRVLDLVDFIERGFQESHSLSQVQSRAVRQLLLRRTTARSPPPRSFAPPPTSTHLHSYPPP